MTPAVVHIVEPEQAVRIGRYILARCGARVERHHGLDETPTCPDCLALIAEDARECDHIEEGTPCSGNR